MRLRQSILPRAKADWLGFVFIFLIIPFMYWVNIFVIVPDKYTVGTNAHILHFLFGTFLLFNITSNLVAMIIVDTSIRGLIIRLDDKLNGNFCAVCETVIPSRCWHCDTCNICILKRDHHCTFAGSCIGHFNHRYFLIFLVYFFIGCLYSSYLTIFYSWKYVDLSPLMALKVIIPLAFWAFGIDNSIDHCLIILFMLSFVGAIISGILLYYHFSLLYKGAVSYEKTHNLGMDYNLGLKNNIITVFGERWYLTWFSPFIQSNLIHNGIQWNDTILPKED